MAKIEPLKCPSCGASKITHISSINYQCNYCHTTFIVKNDASTSQIHSEKQPIDLNRGKNKSVKIFVLFALVMGMFGVGFSFFMLTGDKQTDYKNSSSINNWQKPTIDNYACLLGSKGAIVWLVLKSQTKHVDSIKYQIRLINPQTNKLITEQTLGNIIKSSEKIVNQSNLFDKDLYVNNDTVYNVSDNGGIQAFDLYTGQRLFDNEWFENKFPQLKDGIIKIEKRYFKKCVKITSFSGDDFIYYFDKKKLIPEKQDNNSITEEGVFTEEIYLSKAKKSQLYLCNIKTNNNTNFYMDSYTIESFESNRSFYNSTIKAIKQVNDSVYPKAFPIARYNNNLLFFYASNFNKNADGILALVNSEGNYIWQNRDTTLMKIVTNNNSDNIYFEYNLNNNLVVINTNAKQSVGIDLKTGKTQFVYSQSYSPTN